MPQNWTPQPWTPRGGDSAPDYRINMSLPPLQFYGPGPTDPDAPVEPVMPTNPGDVIYERPGFVPGYYYGNVGGVPGRGLPFTGGGGSGEGFNWMRAGTGILGGLLGGPIGSILSKAVYDRFFGPEPPPFEAQTFPEGYTYEDYQRDLNTPNTFLSQRRPGSTRFSQGEMDLSRLPMYGAPGSLMPAVFAGERGSTLPGGGQAPAQEQR